MKTLPAVCLCVFANLLAGIALPLISQADVPSTVHIFPAADPASRLTADGAGNFYGVEPSGGDYGNGAIFQVAANGSVTVLHSFNGATEGSAPLPLTLGADGNLYGFTTRLGTTTASFGNQGHGTFFRITPAGVFTVLVNFNASDNVVSPTIPPVQVGTSFYGLADGSGSNRGGAVFAIDAGNNVSVILNYPEVNSSRNVNLPTNLVSAGGGVFYFSAPSNGLGYGTVYRLNADGSTTLQLTFGNDANGGTPGSLLFAADGTLYGITNSAGANGHGTFYKISPQGTFSTLTSLTAGPSTILQAAGDAAVTLLGSTLYNVASGAAPTALYTAPTSVGGALAAADGFFLVSVAAADGTGNGATIQRVSSAGAGALFATLPTGGTSPVAPLAIGSGGVLYGTTPSGGASNKGVVFSLTAAGVFQKLADFIGANGAMPRAALTPDGAGNFYGVTSAGGQFGGGEFFEVTSAGALTPLFGFASGGDGNANLGNDPESALVPGPNGLFYGVTRLGGRPQNASYGTVYTINAAGQFNQIAALAGQGGSLVAGGDSNFYGTTGGDGDGSGDGTIFQVTPLGVVTVVAQFNGLGTGSSQAGSGEIATIIRGSDGNFYGTTFTGGQYGHGTIWRMLASDHSLTAIYAFNGGSFSDAIADGGTPIGGLVEGSDHNFYGTTSVGGALGGGTVFQVTPGGFLTTLYGFARDTTSGQSPGAALVQTADGTFFGSTGSGPGASGVGTLFRFNLNGAPTPTPTATPTPTPTPTPAPGSTPTPTPSPTPTPLPGSTPTPLPSPVPTATPTPTPVPSALRLLGLNSHSGGNTGDSTLNISGLGLSPQAVAKLTASGQPDIVATSANLLDAGFTLSASFSLQGAPVGNYDLIVTNPDGATATLPAAFTVVAGGAPDVYFDIVGPPAARALHTTPYFLVVGNRGSVDAYMVPVAFSVSGGYQVQTNVRTVTLPLVDALPAINYPFQLADSLGAAGSADDPLTLVTEGDFSVGAFYLPVVPANSVANILLNVTVSAGGQRPTFYVQGLAAAPELSSLSKLQTAAANAQLSSARRPSRRSHPVLRKDPPPTDPSAYPNPLFDKVILPILQILNKKPNDIVPASKVLNDAAKPVEKAPTTPVTIPENPYPYFDPFPNTPDVFGPFGDPAPPGPPPPPPPDSQPVVPGKSSDPNDKQGSAGVGGTAQFVSGGVPLRYIVEFENEITATLPAQRVVVTDPLDANDDLTTFSLGPIGFGSTMLTPPPNVSSYSAQVDLRPDVNILVNVSAQLDMGSRVVNWTFQSIDPVTGQEPVDPRFGFLPPNVASPAGQGFVFYTVQPKAGLPTGTTITNQATIYFDENPPIPTPVWTNTIDNGAPTSTLQAIAKAQFTSKIKLKVAGGDDASGVANYSIYASDNKGPFQLVLSGQPGPKINFEGTTGHKYEFFAQARDGVGNTEPLKTRAEAKTKISGPDLIGAWEGDVTTKTSGSGSIKLKGKLTVTNQSLKDATVAGGAVRFYVSPVAIFDSSAQVIGRDAPFDALAPGGSFTVSIPGGKLPAGFTSASGLYVYAVLDIGGAVPETDKANNTVPYGPLP